MAILRWEGEGGEGVGRGVFNWQLSGSKRKRKLLPRLLTGFLPDTGSELLSLQLEGFLG